MADDTSSFDPNERMLTEEELQAQALREAAQAATQNGQVSAQNGQAAPAPAPTDPGPDPFAAMGGGVRVGDGWVPKDHPLAQQAAAAAPTAATAVAPGAPGAAGQPAATTIPGQATAASGYTPTPLANPTNPTSNAGSQDVVRNSYLQLATQPIVPSTNDAAVRRPADAYAANVERSVRSNIADAAEANGPYATGAQSGQARMIRERGGALTGEYEANLVLREMTARRSEIQQALSALGGTITEDQRQALQKELARIDASLRSQALGQQGDQFNKELGVNIADKEAYWNDVALRHILQGV